MVAKLLFPCILAFQYLKPTKSDIYAANNQYVYFYENWLSNTRTSFLSVYLTPFRRSRRPKVPNLVICQKPRSFANFLKTGQLLTVVLKVNQGSQKTFYQGYVSTQHVFVHKISCSLSKLNNIMQSTHCPAGI